MKARIVAFWLTSAVIFCIAGGVILTLGLLFGAPVIGSIIFVVFAAFALFCARQAADYWRWLR